MQQIYIREPMPKRDFNKVARFAAHFQNTFSLLHLLGLLECSDEHTRH